MKFIQVFILVALSLPSLSGFSQSKKTPPSNQSTYKTQSKSGISDFVGNWRGAEKCQSVSAPIAIMIIAAEVGDNVSSKSFFVCTVLLNTIVSSFTSPLVYFSSNSALEQQTISLRCR